MSEDRTNFWKPCYSKRDFIAHATELHKLCIHEGHTAEDRESQIAWRAKAQTWLLVAGWLDELPDFQRPAETSL